jgi:hypothetical protein
MIEIFAVAICTYTSDHAWSETNGCSLTTGSAAFHKTLESCQGHVDFLNKQNEHSRKKYYTCYKKTVPAWEPVQQMPERRTP